MIQLTLALLFVTGAADPQRPCVLSGQLTLQTPGGKPESPGGKTAVYVKSVPRTAWPQGPKTHPVKQLNKQFDPQILVLEVGDSVQFENQDKFEHSVFSNSDTKTFDLPRSTKGMTGSETFLEPGQVRLQCDIHQQMRADLLVVENPFHAEPDANGSWQIKPLPAGEYTVVAWEANGAKVTSAGKVRCAGETKVQLPVLKQKPEPKLVHKDGSDYSDVYNR